MHAGQSSSSRQAAVIFSRVCALYSGCTRDVYRYTHRSTVQQQAGYEGCVPVHVCVNLSQIQIRSLVLVDPAVNPCSDCGDL